MIRGLSRCALTLAGFAAALFGQTGTALKGVLPNDPDCLGDRGTIVVAKWADNRYEATIEKGQFVFLKLGIPNPNEKYKVFIPPGQDNLSFRKPKNEAWPAPTILVTLDGPVSENRERLVDPKPCPVIRPRASLQLRDRPVWAKIRPFARFLLAPDDSQQKLESASKRPSISLSLSEGTQPKARAGTRRRAGEVTVAAMEGGKYQFLGRLPLDKKGTATFDPRLYPRRGANDGYIVTFEKPGYVSETLIGESLGDFAQAPVLLRREDPDGTPDTASFVANDGARGRSSSVREIEHLPIPGRRSADSLALLNPGVVPAPMAGTGFGPGIGPTIGSAGEVAVNGIRPRMNNYVTDGADNNDESVGTRRQGFVFAGAYALESIREFQVRTALYDTQYGRASGAHFNLLTMIGEPAVFGKVYGYWADARMSAREYFNPDYSSRAQPASSYYLNNVRRDELYNVAEKDPRSNGAVGFVLGTPLGKHWKLLLQSEARASSAKETRHFVVPAIPQRGYLDQGARGRNFFGRIIAPSTVPGDAIFSLFPFPNNAAGPYGGNTYTTRLPANERGLLYSAKLSRSASHSGIRHHLAGTYSGTTESSTLPVTGGALYSSLRPNVRTYTGTVFLDSQLGARTANQLRAAGGQANVYFGRDQDPDLLPSRFDGDPFLLNRPHLSNVSNFQTPGYDGLARYVSALGTGSDRATGPVGEVRVAGFSGLGPDVFRFPQLRKDRTIQFSELFTRFGGRWTLTAGVDFWRFRFNSQVNPNARPYLQFNGRPAGGAFWPSELAPANDAVVLGMPALALQTQTSRQSEDLVLTRNQIDWFAQSNLRLSNSISLSAGLRVSNGRLPHSEDGRFEGAFDQVLFDQQIVDGRNGCAEGRDLLGNPSPCRQRVNALASAFVGRFDNVFAASRLSFDPRLGIAWRLGSAGKSVLRAGAGRYTNQFPAVILDESRSVFPLGYTLNYVQYSIFHTTGPMRYTHLPTTLLKPGNFIADGQGADPVRYLSQTFQGSKVFNTRPAEGLRNPMHFQFGTTFEHEIRPALAISLAYVGTAGRHLLRRRAPGGYGFSYGRVPDDQGVQFENAFAVYMSDGTDLCLYLGNGLLRFPCAEVSTQYIETAAVSSYHSLQTELHGHWRRLTYRSAFTWSHSIDNSSDFFDTRASFAIPQNSLDLDLRLQRGDSDFDVRKRWTTYFDWQPVPPGSSGPLWRRLAAAWRFAGVHSAQSGMPFTVNTVYDTNGDGLINDGLARGDGLIQPNADPRIAVTLASGFDQGRLVPTRAGLVPALRGVGVVNRNTFRARGLHTLDLSLGRDFSLGDNQITMRLEGFNVTNSPQFGIPVRLLGAPAFGAAFDTSSPNRRLQVNVQLRF